MVIKVLIHHGDQSTVLLHICDVIIYIHIMTTTQSAEHCIEWKLKTTRCVFRNRAIYLRDYGMKGNISSTSQYNVLPFQACGKLDITMMKEASEYVSHSWRVPAIHIISCVKQPHIIKRLTNDSNFRLAINFLQNWTSCRLFNTRLLTHWSYYSPALSHRYDCFTGIYMQIYNSFWKIYCWLDVIINLIHFPKATW